MKGYWIVLGSDVTDQAEQQEYGRLWAPIAAKYEAKIKVLDLQSVLVEARSTTRVIAVQFPSLAQAKACYEDPEYEEAKRHALKASNRELLILEGDLG